MLFSLEAGGDSGIGDFDDEVVRIELFANPLDLFGAFGMRRIGQNVEQVLIAPGASAILWWTIALSADAGRIERRLAWQRAFFDDDRMFPVVAEVVSVDEAGDAGFQQAVQGQAIFVGDVVNGMAIAVLPAGDGVHEVNAFVRPAPSSRGCAGGSRLAR